MAFNLDFDADTRALVKDLGQDATVRALLAGDDAKSLAERLTGQMVPTEIERLHKLFGSKSAATLAAARGLSELAGAKLASQSFAESLHQEQLTAAAQAEATLKNAGGYLSAAQAANQFEADRLAKSGASGALDMLRAMEQADPAARALEELKASLHRLPADTVDAIKAEREAEPIIYPLADPTFQIIQRAQQRSDALFQHSETTARAVVDLVQQGKASDRIAKSASRKATIAIVLTAIFGIYAVGSDLLKMRKEPPAATARP